MDRDEAATVRERIAHNLVMTRLGKGVLIVVLTIIGLGCIAIGVGLAFVDTRIAGAIYLIVTLLWLIPDRRIEHMVYRS